MRGKTILVLLLGVVTTGAAVCGAIHVRGGARTESPPLLQQSFDDLHDTPPGVRPSSPPPAEVLRRRAQRLAREGTKEADAEARRLCEEIIDQHDHDHVEARRLLGYVDFEVDVLGLRLPAGQDPIPEVIGNRRGHEFLDDVEEFHRQRWIRDPARVEAARAAVAAMGEHARRIETDHRYRLGDDVRGDIAHTPSVSSYLYATRWAPPFLVCYSSAERWSDDELASLRPSKRRELREAARERLSGWEPRLDEREAVLTQLYQEFLRRYGERHGLRDLSNPWGGRPDLDGQQRRYVDGVPLVTWVFGDRAAFAGYTDGVRAEDTSPSAAGFFDWKTSWVVVFDEGPSSDTREFDLYKSLSLGTHQLLHGFTRQSNAWRRPRYSYGALAQGIAEYLGSAEMQEDGRLEWNGVNQIRLRNMIGVATAFEARGGEYPVFPVERLAYFTSLPQTTRWASGEWNISGAFVMSLFFQQSWALVYFLHEYDEGRHLEAFHRLLGALLANELGEGMSKTTFQRCMEVRDEADWRRLDAEFQGFVRDDLLQRTPR